MDVLAPHVAGFDVHKETVVVCARHVTPGGQVQKTTRTYRTMTRDLSTLVGWLTNERVTHIAMESTGVYWKPIFNILEEQGNFTVLLCNAQHVKNVPGRKTDVKDCEWLAQLLQHGLLRPSFIPPKPIRELRDLTRHRTKLTDMRTSTANRIHKTLEDANIKLASVASDILGASGRDMIERLIAGDTNSKALAELARQRLRGKIPDLEVALEGRVSDHHRFQLGILYDQLKFLEAQIARVSQRIVEHIAKADAATPPAPEEAGPLFAKLPQTNSARTQDSSEEKHSPLPFEQAVTLLVTIPGVQQVTAECILAELGSDMSAFPSARHLSSWAGMAPGNDESAGKRRSSKTRKGCQWLRRTLALAAWGAGHTKNSYFSSAFGRWSKRRNKKKAIIAVGHALLETVYHMLKRRIPYSDLGPDHFDRLNPEKQARYHVRRLEDLGHKVTLEKMAG